MAEVKFLQLSPGWQKKHLEMHQIDALKYGILNIFLRGSMPPDPPRGVISFSPFSPLTRFHACCVQVRVCVCVYVTVCVCVCVYWWSGFLLSLSWAVSLPPRSILLMEISSKEEQVSAHSDSILLRKHNPLEPPPYLFLSIPTLLSC